MLSLPKSLELNIINFALTKYVYKEDSLILSKPKCLVGNLKIKSKEKM